MQNEIIKNNIILLIKKRLKAFIIKLFNVILYKIIFMDLYLDCEWQIPNKLFLIGFAYNQKDFFQLYDHSLTLDNVVKMFSLVDGCVYFYGPDIAIIEKYFEIDIRNTHRCINLIRVFKYFNPYLSSYKLKCLEWHYGIKRESVAYKVNIFQFLCDWYKPEKRKQCLKYNKEDVINLIKIKKIFFSEHNIKQNMLDNMLLK